MKIKTDEVDVLGALRENGQSVNNIIHAQTWVNPTSFDDEGVYPATLLPDTVPLEVTTGFGTWDYPRVLYTNTTAGNPTGDLYIEGTDYNDNAINETVTLNNSWKNTVRAYKTVTKIIFPVRDAAGDTVSVGYDVFLGSDVVFSSKAIGLKAVRYTATAQLATAEPLGIEIDPTDISKCWYHTMEGDGASNIMAYAIPNPDYSYQTAQNALLTDAAIQKVAVVENIDATVLNGVTELFTVPAGKTFIMKSITVRTTAITVGGKTTQAQFSMGENDPDYNYWGSYEFPTTQLGDLFFCNPDPSWSFKGGDVIKVKIMTASDATEEKYAMDVWGYFTDAPTYQEDTSIKKLATVTGIDATTVADTTIYTPPSGKIFIPAFVTVRVTAFTLGSKNIDASISIGSNAPNYDNINGVFTSADITSTGYNMGAAYTAAGSFYPPMTDSTPIKVSITVASDADVEEYAVDLFGYLVDA